MEISIVPQKLKIELPYNISIPLLGIFLKNLGSLLQIYCVLMFFVALFTIGKIWNQATGLSMDE
jgi:hypothetical protein